MAQTQQQSGDKFISDLQTGTMAGTASALSANTIRLWDTLNLVRNGQPETNSRNRKTYDDALRLGGGDQARTIAFLEVAMSNHIKKLSKTLSVRADAGNNPQAIEELIKKISTGAEDPTQQIYLHYRPLSQELSTILANLQRTSPVSPSPKAQPVQSDKSALSSSALLGGSEQLRAVDQILFDFGHIHYLSNVGNLSNYAVGGVVSGEQLSAFGGNKKAGQAFVDAFALCIAAKANGEKNSVGAKELADALGGVKNPQIKNDDAYKNALAAAKKGDREGALEELKKVGALYDTFFKTANNLIIVQVDSRAITVFTGKFTLRYDLPNMKDFMTYMRTDQADIGPKLVSLALQASADILRLSGQVGPGKLDGEGKSVFTGSTERVSGSGYALGLTPMVAFGAGLNQTPIIIVAHCNFGYEKWALNPVTIKTASGGVKEETVSGSGPFIGVYGLEVQFPGKTGDRSTIRLERAGVGAVGDPRNALAYFTLSKTWTKDNDSRIQTLVSPVFSGFVPLIGNYQPRVGATVEPYNYFTTLSQGGSMAIGPTLRADFNTATNVWTLDGGFKISWAPDSRWNLSANLGLIGEAGGMQAQRLPWSPYGGLGVQLNLPGEPSAVVPRKVKEGAKKSANPFSAVLSDAKNFISTQSLLVVDGTQGKIKARDFAGQLQGAAILAANAPLRNNATFKSAVDAYRAGDIRKGTKLLEELLGG